MAAGDGNTDAENGVTMAARDRFGSAAGSQAPNRSLRRHRCRRTGRGAGSLWRHLLWQREARAAYRDAGHDTVIKPGPLRPAVPGGFTIDDFTIDERASTVTCPAGLTRPVTRTRTVTFGGLRQLPAAPAMHHRQGRPLDEHPPDEDRAAWLAAGGSDGAGGLIKEAQAPAPPLAGGWRGHCCGAGGRGGGGG